jgi:hypothetical protein
LLDRASLVRDMRAVGAAATPAAPHG